jgi:NAD(P)H-dependent FMN reductase
MSKGPILIISGTNRPGSNALKIAKTLENHYRKENAPVELFSLENLPPEAFNPASYAAKPPAVVSIQNRILAASGLHVVTPEYNGSFPGVLKYFIDLLKFPESFENKPVAYVGEAVGLWGGLRAVEQLQQIFGYRNAHSFPMRVFIPSVGKLIDASGNLTSADIQQRLVEQVKGFIRYVKIHESAELIV